MTLIKAGTEVSYTVTFLEMHTAPSFPVPDLPADVRLEKAIAPPNWYFLSLYRAVGSDYEWQDRFDDAPSELAAELSDPRMELWTLFGDGWPKGFFLLDFRQPGTCDLAYFGMVPEAIGGGLGGKLLKIAILKAWAGENVQKVTVNTCTLDHPRALPLYKNMGFDPVREAQHARVLTRDRDPSKFPQ